MRIKLHEHNIIVTEYDWSIPMRPNYILSFFRIERYSDNTWCHGMENGTFYHRRI